MSAKENNESPKSNDKNDFFLINKSDATALKISTQKNNRRKSLFKTYNEEDNNIKNKLINRIKNTKRMKDNETKNERENSFEKYIRKKTEFNTSQMVSRP